MKLDSFLPLRRYICHVAHSSVNRSLLIQAPNKARQHKTFVTSTQMNPPPKKKIKTALSKTLEKLTLQRLVLVVARAPSTIVQPHDTGEEHERGCVSRGGLSVVRSLWRLDSAASTRVVVAPGYAHQQRGCRSTLSLPLSLLPVSLSLSLFPKHRHFWFRKERKFVPAAGWTFPRLRRGFYTDFT